MKKILVALTLALTIGNANALSIAQYIGAVPHHTPQYNNGYHNGYNNGKKDAYNNVARTAVVVGLFAVATVIIYQATKETRWTANEKGVVYRF